jgi:hypothetical protein
VKAEGGYVIVPPSIHPTGCAYRWLNDEPLAEAPPWLVALARKPLSPPPPQEPSQALDAPRASCGAPGAYGAAALRGEIAILTATRPGDRNNQTNKSSFSLFQLVAGGELDAAEVERALIEAATANGLVADDGMSSVIATIRSGARAGLLHPRTRHGGGA